MPASQPQPFSRPQQSAFSLGSQQSACCSVAQHGSVVVSATVT
jgi:hypothetical protein